MVKSMEMGCENDRTWKGEKKEWREGGGRKYASCFLLVGLEKT
jgi:hypothetical protein